VASCGSGPSRAAPASDRAQRHLEHGLRRRSVGRWLSVPGLDRQSLQRECLAIEIGQGLGGRDVAAALERLRFERGLPPRIYCDYGPESAGRTLDAWAYARGVALRFIRPGKPIENAYVESFNGKFRDECLNEHWFMNLVDAKTAIEAWRVDYNTVRPHSSLGGRTPDQFAAISGGARGPRPARTNEALKSEDLALSADRM
jgi:putative transposase